MKIHGEPGSAIACAALRAAGIEHVFGLPGSSIVPLWALAQRDPNLRVICATSELTASFMANGYARASGRTAALLTIAGPGFTYALSGLAEAALDSIPLVHLLVAPSADLTDGGAGLQAIPQFDIVRPLVKDVLRVSSASDVYGAIVQASARAVRGEPGPVVVELQSEALVGTARRTTVPDDDAPLPSGATLDPAVVAAVIERLKTAVRPLIFCGQGAASASRRVRRLAEALPAPVITTTSGRGVLSEAHALALVYDAPGAPIGPLNDLVASSDLVLMLGCKLSHNASRGSRLVLPAERLVRVDACPDVLARRETSLAVEADVDAFLAAAEDGLSGCRSASTWTPQQVASHRQAFRKGCPVHLKPKLGESTAEDFVAALRRHLPEQALIATDSGLHQYVLRAHLAVVAPRTFLVPTNFQSMGYGIPAAIGGTLATGQPAVVVTGDGGLNIVGLELLTAVRERARLTVIVFVDRELGLIRLAGVASGERDPTLGIDVPDIALLAASLDIPYARVGDGDDVDQVLAAAFAVDGVSFVEVPVGDLPGLRRMRARGLTLSATRMLLGGEAMRRARQWRRRER